MFRPHQLSKRRITAMLRELWPLAAGAIIAFVGGWWVNHMIRHQEQYLGDWWGIIRFILMLMVATPLTIVLWLFPARRMRIIAETIEVLTIPYSIGWKLALHYQLVIIPLLMFMFVTATPILIWMTFKAFGISLPIGGDAAFYLGAVLAGLVMTYSSRWLLQVAFRWVDGNTDYAQTLRYVEPRLMRLYVYTVVAGAYAVSNVEKFSGVRFWNSPVWAPDNNFILAVLLTYAAFDRVVDLALGICRERSPEPGNKR